MPCMEVWGGNDAVDRGVIMPGLDAWLYSRPYHGDQGGGDVHYVSSCATGRITRLLVADVSGHGAAVAETGEKLRRLMQRFVNHLDQTRLVVSLNEQFVGLSKQGCFATSVVGTFFAPTNRLTLSNAGHPPPLLYRRRDDTWTYLERQSDASEEADNLPLGVLKAARYDFHDVQLRVDDLVLCYTDSLNESLEQTGRQLGTAGLLETVRTLDAKRPDVLIAALLEAIAARHPGNLTRDDVTVLLVRPNGLVRRVPLGRRLKVPFQMAARILKSLWPGGAPTPWPQMSLTNIGGAFFDGLNRKWKAESDDDA